MATGDQHHKRHVIAWLALVFITLVALNAVLFSYLFEPGDGSEVLSSVVCGDNICSATEQACLPAGCAAYYCLADCDYPDIANQNANTNQATPDENTNAAPTNAAQPDTATAIEVDTASGLVSTVCATADDCALVDVTYDSSVCCQTPTCSDYSTDDYVAVNRDAYLEQYEAGQANCAATTCPAAETDQCPQTVENDNYSVDCQAGICQKIYFDN